MCVLHVFHSRLTIKEIRKLFLKQKHVSQITTYKGEALILLSSLACYREDDPTDWHTEADTKFTYENDEVGTLGSCKNACKDLDREYFTWKGPKGEWDSSKKRESECWCSTGIKERKNIEGFYSGKTVMEGKCLSEIPCKFYIYCH